ncbi:unnamed protein product, partial [marine sediment metagenome]
GCECFNGDVTVAEYIDLCHFQDKIDESNERLTDNEVRTLIEEIINRKNL